MVVKPSPVLARALVVALLLASCAPVRAPAAAPTPLAPVSLVGPGGRPVDLRGEAADARLTVLVFFSAHCHCLDRHEARLRALYDAYAPRNVKFFMVDSEVGGSRVRDDHEAEKRRLAFPILLDPGAVLARWLGARYATYSVVLDGGGFVRYRGGIDSDKTHLHDDASLYLKDALDDLLAGRDPRVASAEALGCALETW